MYLKFFFLLFVSSLQEIWTTESPLEVNLLVHQDAKLGAEAEENRSGNREGANQDYGDYTVGPGGMPPPAANRITLPVAVPLARTPYKAAFDYTGKPYGNRYGGSEANAGPKCMKCVKDDCKKCKRRCRRGNPRSCCECLQDNDCSKCGNKRNCECHMSMFPVGSDEDSSSSGSSESEERPSSKCRRCVKKRCRTCDHQCRKNSSKCCGCLEDVDCTGCSACHCDDGFNRRGFLNGTQFNRQLGNRRGPHNPPPFHG